MLALLLLLSLQMPTGVDDTALVNWRPDSAVAYDSVPAIYNKWWKEIQDCAGVKGMKLKKIHWFEVHSVFYCPIVRYCLGWWKAKGQEIFILQNLVREESLIKHEMLHEILWAKDIDRKFMNHNEFFKKCGLQGE